MAEFGFIPLWCNIVQMGLGMALRHYGTTAPWHYGRVWLHTTLVQHGTGRSRHGTMGLWRYGTLALWHYALWHWHWHYGAMAEFGCIPLWCNMVQKGLGNGTMTLWHYGTSAPWHYGRVWLHTTLVPSPAASRPQWPPLPPPPTHSLLSPH